MVITRSQSNQNREIDIETMDRSSDNESETSFREVLSREQIADLDSDDLLNRRRNNDNYSIHQRFNEINRQIGDLTNIVLTLTQQFTSVNGEGNELKTAVSSANSRSDKHYYGDYSNRRIFKPSTKSRLFKASKEFYSRNYFRFIN